MKTLRGAPDNAFPFWSITGTYMTKEEYVRMISALIPEKSTLVQRLEARENK